VLDAMISWRPYKEPWSIQEARKAILEGAGSQFDPDVMAEFLDVLDSGDFETIIEWAGEMF
jgi:putative two-component system response regulator